jgi:hypothetical protein
MHRSFAEVFGRHGSAGTPENQEALARALDAAFRDIARALLPCSPALREDLLSALTQRVRTLLNETDALARQMPPAPEANGTGEWNLPGVTNGFPWAKLSPEPMEWARQGINEEEIIAGMREIEETGGLEFRDLFPELEEGARRSE